MKYLIIDILFVPTLGIIIGSAILFIVGYVHWYKGTKNKITKWLETKIFKNSFDSKV